MKNDFNTWAQHVHRVKQGETQHLVNHEPSNIKFYCYSEGPYHAAHLFHCQHGFYPFGATIVDLSKGKKVKLKKP